MKKYTSNEIKKIDKIFEEKKNKAFELFEKISNFEMEDFEIFIEYQNR